MKLKQHFFILIIGCLFFLLNDIEGTRVPFKAGILDTENEPKFNPQSYLQDKIERSRAAVNNLFTPFNEKPQNSPSLNSEKNLQEEVDNLISELFVHPQLDAWEQQKDRRVLVLMELESPEVREELISVYNLESMNYMGNGVYLTQLSLDELSHEFSDDDENMAQGILWIGHYSPRFKSVFKLPSSSSSSSPNSKSMKSNLESDKNTPSLTFSIVLRSPSSSIEKVTSRNHKIASQLNQLFEKSNLKARVQFETHRRASLECDHSLTALKVIPILSELENVAWISMSVPKKLTNQYGHVIMQNGAQGNIQLNDTVIWNKGIRGDGEIVTVLDSGLDWDNCFFADESGEAPPSSGVDQSRRKVIGYHRLAADVLSNDPVNGHGTHVTGTVAGSIMTSEDNYDELHHFNGMAPDAKILMQASENSNGGLSIPGDLVPLLEESKSVNSYVHTNSWGSNWSGFVSCDFDCDCVWGPLAGQLDGLTPGEKVDDDVCRENLGAECCYIGSVYDSNSQNIDEGLNENDEMIMLFAASNEGAMSSKSSISNQAASKNALSVGSSNTAVDNFAESWKYVDLLQMANIYGYGDSIDTCCNNEQVCCESYWKNTAYSDQDRYSPQSVTYFSSRGPTYDGRMSPQVVAPGSVVLSTHSDGDINSNNCGTMSPRLGNAAAILRMQGTSMATPGVAGAAALIREYFRKGYYPSGDKNDDDSMSPSGMLVKAMLIGSGTPLSRTVDGNRDPITVSSDPNRYAGYGLIDLSRVLQFSDSDFSLSVSDGRSLSSGSSDTFQFTANEDGELRVTLTWYDPPAMPSSSQVIVNRLQLQVGDSSASQMDVTQQLSVNVAQGDEVSIRVSGMNISEGPQKYAMVMTHPQGELSDPQREMSGGSSGAILSVISCSFTIVIITIVSIVV